MAEYKLELRGVCKSFPGVKALDNVQLSLRPGTVHALMGENGAGKSTLMKCLFGIYKMDAGEIILDGEKVEINNPDEAMKKGIAMVHQELQPVPARSVAENMYLGRFPTKCGPLKVIDHKKMYEDTAKWLKEVKMDFDPKAQLGSLSIGQMQSVEIAKAVSQQAKVIIFDEPTSSLSDNEVEALFRIMNDLRDKGVAMVYISHKMDEIKRIADDITIMRDGTYVGTWPAAELTTDQIIAKMVGRELTNVYPPKENKPGEVIMEVKDLCSIHEKSFQHVSFQLRKGEILGFGGLSESGMHEIGKAIFGASYDREGTVELADGTQINDIPTAIKHSIAYTSKDRDNESVVLNQSIGDNICLPSLDELSGPAHLISDKKKKDFANKFAKQMSVKMVDVNQFVSNLSGGNKQKVVLARWIGKDSDIVVLDSPTRGIDIKVKQDIYQLMNQMRKNGKSIIMISEELMELIGMCDRIMIMKDGKISGELERDQNLDENGLITMMV